MTSLHFQSPQVTSLPLHVLKAFFHAFMLHTHNFTHTKTAVLVVCNGPSWCYFRSILDLQILACVAVCLCVVEVDEYLLINRDIEVL
jgi:hypothetical protein